MGLLLRLYDCSGRRQPDERQNHAENGTADGKQSAYRHYSGAADDRRRAYAFCPHATVRRQGLRPDCGGRSGLLAGRRQQLLGAQRDYPGQSIYGMLRPAGSRRQSAFRRAYSEPRLCRSRAYPPRRLVGLAAAGAEGKLRRTASDHD